MIAHAVVTRPRVLALGLSAGAGGLTVDAADGQIGGLTTATSAAGAVAVLAAAGMRPVARSTDWLFQRAALDGRKLSEVYNQDVLHFGLEGGGPVDTRIVVGRSEAARTALTGDEAAMWERLVRGLHASADAIQGESHLGGIAFTTTDDGMLAMRLASEVAFKKGRMSAGGIRHAARNIAVDDRQGFYSTASQDITFGATLTQLLTRPENRRQAARAAWSAAHELAHTKGNGGTPVTWVNETTANVIAYNHQHDVAGRLGLDIGSGKFQRKDGYLELDKDLARLTREAGWDTRSPAGARRIEQLMASGGTDDFIATLAHEIHARHGGDLRQIRYRIDHGDHSPQVVADGWNAFHAAPQAKARG